MNTPISPPPINAEVDFVTGEMRSAEGASPEYRTNGGVDGASAEEQPRK